MNTKVCSKCGKEKPLEDFSKMAKGKHGLQACCKLCIKEADALRYKEHSSSIITRNKLYKAKVLKWIESYKKEHSCTLCGESHPATLQFHHPDRTLKENNVSDMGAGCSLEHVMEEVKKCVVLCANCHFKLHWNEKQDCPLL